MPESEERKEAAFQQAAEAYGRLQRFSLLAQQTSTEELQKFFVWDREPVLEAVQPVKGLNGRASVLVERLEEADRPGKFAKAFRVLQVFLRDYVKTSDSGRSQKKSPLSRPHEASLSAS